MKYRFVAPAVAAGLLLTSACSQDADQAPEEALDCLHTVEGPGDLEVTDTAFTPMDGNRASYAVQLTNHSETETAMLSTVRITLLDDDGEAVRQQSDDTVAEDYGTFEYIPPGETKYWAGTWPEDLASAPADMKVDFPQLQHPEFDNKTFWWPHEDVEYPKDIKTTGVEVKREPDGSSELIFYTHNDSEGYYPHATAVIILRNSDGELVGGQEIGPGSKHSDQRIDVHPGGMEHPLDDAFQDGMPPGATDMEVQLTNAPRWQEVDANCPFAYDAPQPA